MSQTTSEPHGLRVLVLDGGDLRAVSQLIILKEIIGRIEHDTHRGWAPYQLFDVIMGVGTGGVIAILLVVFRMTVDQATEEFIRIYKLVYEERDSSPQERIEKLRGEMEGLVERYRQRLQLGEEAKLMNLGLSSDMLPSDEHCLLSVGTVTIQHVNTYRHIRNYRCRSGNIEATIIEAALATCAMPKLCTPVRIGGENGEMFVSARYTFSNPTPEAVQELRERFSSRTPVSAIISLGCGNRRPISLPSNLGDFGEMVERLALDCEGKANELQQWLGPEAPCYRLSVDRGLESSSVTVSAISASTNTYLQQYTRFVNRCADALMSPPRARISDFSPPPSQNFVFTHPLPPLSPFFVPRWDILEMLRQLLIARPDNSRRLVVLSGMPGSGKTQMAAKFGHIFQSELSTAKVIYIDASSRQTVSSGLISRVNALGYRCHTMEEAKLVLANWNFHKSSWLLIFDNANDERVALPIPPSSQGSILITTRDRTFGEYHPDGHIPMSGMLVEDAVKVLLTIVLGRGAHPTPAQEKSAQDIATELECLPVALVQAGCYIKETGCNIMNYLDRLHKHRKIIFNHRIRQLLEDYPVNVYTVFDLAVQRLSPSARALLSLLSCGHYVAFPRPLLILAARHHFRLETIDLIDRPANFEKITDLLYDIFSCREGWDAVLFDKTIMELQRAALVSIHEVQGIRLLNVHPLQHSWAQDRLDSQESKRYKAAMARLLSCGTGPEGANWHESMVSHIRALKSSWGEIHINDRASFADLLAFPGIADDAVEIWESVHKEVLGTYGPADERTMQVMDALALAYATQGDEKREKSMRDQINELRHSLSQATLTRSRAASTSSTAPPPRTISAIIPREETSPASSLEQRILQIANRPIRRTSTWEGLDTNDPAFLDTVRRLALQLQAEGQYQQAEVVARRWLDEVTTRRGALHQDTLAATKCLVVVYEKLEKYDQAIIYQKIILGHAQFENGSDHPVALVCKERLATLYETQGNGEEARRLQMELMTTLTQQATLINQETISVMDRLAASFERASMVGRAATLRRILNRHSPASAFTLNVTGTSSSS